MKQSFLDRKMVILGALFSVSASVNHAGAQPGNPGPEGTGQEVYDFGEIAIPFSGISPNLSISQGGHVWFRFHLSEPITPLANWLDIDTAGPSGIPNNEVAIYDAWANKIGEDNDNGGSGNSNANDWAAAMSFGGGSGQRLSGDAPGWGGGRISDGVWGSTLQPGVYYVVITGYDASFPDPNESWIAPSKSTATGTVRLRLSTGEVPPTFWNERHHGPSAGSVPATAQVVEGHGPLSTIVTRFGQSQRDMFKIRICDPSIFQVTATLSRGEDGQKGGGGLFRGRLFLFDKDGHGISAINNTISNTNTVLVPNQTLPRGEYYLAVTSYCAGFWGEAPGDGGPLDAADRALWDFTAHNNVSIAPNGLGAVNPIAYWARQIGCNEIDEANEFYYTRLTLAGACHVPAQASCPVDFDGSGKQDLFDFAEFQNCFDGP